MHPIKILTNKIVDLGNSFVAEIPMIIAAIIILIITYFVAKVAEKILHHSLSRIKMSSSIIEVFKKLLSVGVWMFGITLASISVFPSLTFSNIVTVVGLGSVAVGFAFKDIFENFIAGLLILVRQTFLIKDKIECNNYSGTVEKITMRDTHIRRSDGERVVLPNALLFKNPVRVITDLEIRQAGITISISSDEDVAKISDMIAKIIKDKEHVSQDNDISILATQFSNGTIDYEIKWWSNNIAKSKHDIISAIRKELYDKNIGIDSHSTTVLFKNTLQISQKDNSKTI